MSNKLFQSVVHQMKENISRTVGVIDQEGTVIACTELERVGKMYDGIINELSYHQDKYIYKDLTFKAIGFSAMPDYAVFISGSDSAAYELACVLAVTLSSVKEYSDDKYDKAVFVKNIILDNILQSDIIVKARELHFPVEISRAVIIFRLLDKSDIPIYEIIQGLFPEKQKDYVLSLSETDIVLIKEIKPDIEISDLEKLARSVVDTLNSEYYVNACVGIGTVTGMLTELARSFKEAQVAIEVGKVFDTEKTIMSYNNLGIGRLIYQLPTTLCQMFLNEVFKKGLIESLDSETLFTIQKFFENNLNVSETSRKLFVHRNTLVYRLEKIRRITGLDLREFDHAIIFKVALMVNKYLVNNPVKY